MAYDYQSFKQEFLVENYRDIFGKPKHTRLAKKQFYKYNEQLKEEFGFDLSVCDECSCTSHNGLPLMMELEHINRRTNDSRIENLRSLCPNCHSQTDGYKNRTSTIEQYWSKVWGKVWSKDNV